MSRTGERDSTSSDPSLPNAPELRGLSMAELKARANQLEEDDSSAVQTLSDDELSRDLTMAQLKARIEADRAAAAAQEARAPLESPRATRPRFDDDDLNRDPPQGDLHLGHFGGWRKGRRARLFLLAGFGVTCLVIALVYWALERQRHHDRLHPLPEVEATITPDTPREMTISEGKIRVSLKADPPAINTLHLPDRDIVLPEGVDFAHFKVEVIDGQTVSIKVLEGKVREILTGEDAKPLLPESN